MSLLGQPITIIYVYIDLDPLCRIWVHILPTGCQWWDIYYHYSLRQIWSIVNVKFPKPKTYFFFKCWLLMRQVVTKWMTKTCYIFIYLHFWIYKFLIQPSNDWALGEPIWAVPNIFFDDKCRDNSLRVPLKRE